jgi:beta-glucanase (GH16 family)
MLRRIAICSALFFLMACRQDEKPVLVWSDEFDDAGAPDSTRWGYDLGGDGWGNNELQYYTRDIKNVRAENGKLIIEAHRDSLNGKAYTSTRLISKGKGDWRYGRIEIKAKLPKGRGTWPAIWMLSTDWKYGGWPESGEIDIMEHVGFDPGVVHGTIHTQTYNHIKQTQKEGKITVENTDGQFHVYTLDWTKDRMDFLVDDKVFYSVMRDPAEDFKGWPFDQRFYLILNLAVGGNWGGQKGVDETIWPQRLEIDYVRVFQTKDNARKDELVLSR